MLENFILLLFSKIGTHENNKNRVSISEFFVERCTHTTFHQIFIFDDLSTSGSLGVGLPNLWVFCPALGGCSLPARCQ